MLLLVLVGCNRWQNDQRYKEETDEDLKELGLQLVWRLLARRTRQGYLILLFCDFSSRYHEGSKGGASFTT